MKLVHNRITDKQEYIADELFNITTYIDLSSSIDYWANIGTQFKDYKFVRKQIQILAYMTGFDNLKDPQKIIAAEWFAVVKEDRDKVLTLEEQIIAGINFNDMSITSRTERLNKTMAEIYSRLSWSDANEVINDVETYKTKATYISYGREGTIKGDPEGMYDYIMSTVGTTWEGIGFISKGFTVEGMTMTELADKFLSILENGD
jgi:hypothetical protein